MEDDVTLDMSKTYIYDGQEYILTGRIAKKTTEPAPPPSRRVSGRVVKDPPKHRKPPDLVVEIKPAPRNSKTPNFGGSFTGAQCQWVKYKDLHMVEDILQGTDDEGSK